MNAPTIIEYNKAEKCKLNEGYHIRPLIPWESIIIHTTNGSAGSDFLNEAKFLQESKDVGAHFLVSKDTRIAQIVPLTHQAYHAGVVRERKYSNARSIGIEVHFTPKEKNWTLQQLQTLTWLVKTLPRLETVTHRFAASPPGRKIDPSGLTDSFFALWTSNYDADFVQITLAYNANVRVRATTESNIKQTLPAKTVLFAVITFGETVKGSNVWYQIGMHEFIHASAVAGV